MANPSFFYTNSVIATVPAAGGAPTVLTSAFDEDPSIVAWKSSGIYFTAAQKTYSYLFAALDPARQGAIVRSRSSTDAAVDSSFSLSRDGSTIAYLGSDATKMAEVFVAPAAMTSPKRVTDMNAQTANWTTSTLDVVSWKSQDGATVEGVLHKPADFNPARKYPLLVVIHGGPTGVSRAIPFTSTIYPIDVWVPRGVLVLEPNYRGSAGYGGLVPRFQRPQSRHRRRVGRPLQRGLADRERHRRPRRGRRHDGLEPGRGYISAFLATHDAARFKAISVGAGISDWTTYYVNTDITPFTRQYLKATPWDDPEIYAKTSPITYIKQAKTPTLIQHGATDQRAHRCLIA